MRKICYIDGCHHQVKARGMCPQHYRRWQYDGNPEAAKHTDTPKDACSVNGCAEPVRTRGLCPMHYKRWLKHGDPHVRLVAKSDLIFDWGDMPAVCIMQDCDKPAAKRGLCSAHYSRQYRWGKQEFSSRNMLDDCPVCGTHKYVVALLRGMCCFCWQSSKRSREGTQQRLYRFWNKETLIAAGIEWHKRTGCLPRYCDWNPRPSENTFPGSTTAVRYFGSWSNYLDALDRRIKMITLRERVAAASRQ